MKYPKEFIKEVVSLDKDFAKELFFDQTLETRTWVGEEILYGIDKSYMSSSFLAEENNIETIKRRANECLKYNALYNKWKLLERDYFKWEGNSFYEHPIMDSTMSHLAERKYRDRCVNGKISEEIKDMYDSLQEKLKEDELKLRG